MDDTGPFSIGEKVLVPHTDKYYEAKVLKSEYRDDGMWYYFLHYTGWNKKWDEWVEETGLQKNSRGGDGSGSKKSRRPAGQGGLKKRRLDEIGGAAMESSVHLELELPAALKKLLVEDHEAVSKEGRVVPLPRKPCVHDILQQYINQAQGRGPADTEDEVSHGIRTYFDKALGQCLLYPTERQQYQQMTADGKCPSYVYGAEHLLRLFVKLPELLPLKEDRVAALRDCLQQVLAYLMAHQREFFIHKEAYLLPPPSLTHTPTQPTAPPPLPVHSALVS